MADVQTDPRVDAYIEKAAPFAQPILKHIRRLMHQAAPGLTESVKWGMPFFTQQGVILGNMAAFKQHCAFGFWGSEMKQLLAKDGQPARDAMGSLGRITNLQGLPSDKTLLTYMRHAAELVESGQRTKSIDRSMRRTPAKPRPVRVPAELRAALKKNKLAAKVFADFSPSCRREYADWIAEAKRPETREKRLAQAISWMAQGKTRNWKYQNC
jgi:uncharacterized protein YdeI (YjbR/CyaY-like superfamily)